MCLMLHNYFDFHVIIFGRWFRFHTLVVLNMGQEDVFQSHAIKCAILYLKAYTFLAR
jgi:hypothetical protein